MPIPTFHHPILRRAYNQFSPLIKSKKTASYFTITLSLFSLSFFGLFAVRPTIITATSLVKSVNDLKKLNSDYENKISSIVRAQSEYELIRNDLPLINLSIPANATFNSLAQNIEKYAQQENLTIIQFQIDPVPISNLPPANKLYSYHFNLIVIGDYSSLSLFIQHVLNWQRLTTITSLDMAREGSGDNKGLIRMTMKGSTYYEP